MKYPLLTLTLVLRVAAQPVLPGTAPLTPHVDLAADMVGGINEYLLHATASSVALRSALWKRDYTSTERYERSIANNREQLSKIIGAVDPRLPVTEVEFEGTTSTPDLIAVGKELQSVWGALARDGGSYCRRTAA